jgi:hypothetical protein
MCRERNNFITKLFTHIVLKEPSKRTTLLENFSGIKTHFIKINTFIQVFIGEIVLNTIVGKWKNSKEFVTRFNEHLQAFCNHNYNPGFLEDILGSRHHFCSIENSAEIL